MTLAILRPSDEEFTKKLDYCRPSTPLQRIVMLILHFRPTPQFRTVLQGLTGL